MSKLPKYTLDDKANELRWQLIGMTIVFGLISWWGWEQGYIETGFWTMVTGLGCAYIALGRLRVRKYLKGGVYEDTPSIR